jgi:hypothetical protein
VPGSGGVQGAGMVVAEDTAASCQAVLVQGAYLALSELPAVGESGMPRAGDGWRARPAVGAGCISGSPAAAAGWIALVSCMTVPAPMALGSLPARGAGAVPGPL